MAISPYLDFPSGLYILLDISAADHPCERWAFTCPTSNGLSWLVVVFLAVFECVAGMTQVRNYEKVVAATFPLLSLSQNGLMPRKGVALHNLPDEHEVVNFVYPTLE